MSQIRSKIEKMHHSFKSFWGKCCTQVRKHHKPDIDITSDSITTDCNSESENQQQHVERLPESLKENQLTSNCPLESGSFDRLQQERNILEMKMEKKTTEIAKHVAKLSLAERTSYLATMRELNEIQSISSQVSSSNFYQVQTCSINYPESWIEEIE